MSELAVIAIPAFAVLDRLFGADKPAFKGKKAVIAGAALGVGYLAGSWFGMALGALWMVYRALPFFGGSGAPRNMGERLAALLRHLIPLPVAYLAAQQLGGTIDRTLYGFGLYAIAAAGLAIWYGFQALEAEHDGEPIGDQNVLVEAIRGACFGVAMLIALGGR